MNLNIVLVDDDPDILELLTYTFKKQGDFIYAFESPKEAFHFISQNKPDIIISDWMMPEIDGVQLCRLLTAVPELKHIPFVFLTCKDDKADKDIAWSSGASEFITKPVKISELKNTIKNLLILQK